MGKFAGFLWKFEEHVHISGYVGHGKMIKMSEPNTGLRVI
jgi:hypothetical protein